MNVGKQTWSRVSPLLDELLDLDDVARAARLDAVRAHDPELAHSVQAMLGHLPAVEDGGFMAEPAVPRPAGLAGQAIGPYTLEREIGHGGMGTVWLARRNDGRFEGQVAVKFLRSGLFGHGDAERFEREGRILGRLSHPNIARMLDAGVTADGQQPYLVLEYIDGEPIDEYCHRLALPVAARLRLLLDVLSAVAHAHNRLILHRDLKPTNILVNRNGEVKLLDFGIAKLLDDAATDQTALTARAGNAFTPEFAAPEQMQGGDVTTATDVYALGVLMYILLGGDHPTASATGAPLDRMRSVIETVPKALSDAVLRRGGPKARYSPESRKLSAEVSGDIETIAAKALKKSPHERYANAAEFGDDVRRFLAHEPIAARPDARLYRVAKFVQRHWAGVAAASVAVFALGGGVGVALWQAHEAQAQRVQAEGLIEYMIGDLRKKLEPVGRLDVLDGVGSKALAYYAAQNLDRLDADSLGRRARALHMIGDLADRRGKFEEAERDFQEAAMTTSKLMQREPNEAQRIFDQSQSEFYVGYVQWRRGHLRDAEAAFRRYLDMAERMNRARPGDHDWQLEHLFAAENLAIVLIDQDRAQEALALSTWASQAMEQTLSSHPEDAVSVATLVGWRAIAQTVLGHDEEAVRDEKKKIALALRAPGASTDQEVRYLVGNGNNEIGRWQRNLGLLEDAHSSATVALKDLLALNERDTSNLEVVGEIISTRILLGELAEDRGDRVEAQLLMQSASKGLADLLANPTAKRGWRLSYSGTLALLQARLALSDSQRLEAETTLATYLSDVHKYEAQGGDVPALELPTVARAELARGDLLALAGQSAQARVAWRSAAARIRAAAEHQNPAAMTTIAHANLRLGATKDARYWADKVLGTTYRHPAFADLQQRLGPEWQAGITPRP